MQEENGYNNGCWMSNAGERKRKRGNKMVKRRKPTTGNVKKREVERGGERWREAHLCKATRMNDMHNLLREVGSARMIIFQVPHPLPF
ncbi:hypothetical protein EYF80_035634 [Liparis tanakae]|uniref:Uncharacterized protein n=1 Tax=Liparis tanakae TaxID=230148 RepID=A0A4Z2GNC2_9TELE|nr:hypothetical protein EYF80_035634 [Liparis tanakae]